MGIVQYVPYNFKALSLYQILPIVIIGIIISILWHRRKLYILSLKLPGPVGYPLVGNAIQLECINNMEEMTHKFCDLKKKYGEIFCIWYGVNMNVVISEPEDFECVLLNKRTSIKASKYDVMTELWGPHLLSGNGPVLKLHRYILNPSFNKTCLNEYQRIDDKYARHMAENVSKLCDKGETNIVIHCKRLATDVLLEALFGLPSEFYKGELDDIIATEPRIALLLFDRMTKPWYTNTFIYSFSSAYKELTTMFNKFKNYHHTRLEEKIDQIISEYNKENHQNINLDDDDVKNKRYRNSLEVMVEAYLSKKISKEEILHEFNGFFFTGVDTMYTAFSFFIVMMGIHKRCQDLVWKEIRNAFSDDLDANVTSKHLSKLPYLDMCLKEVSRLFPTGSIQMRISEEDFPLKHRDIVIPKGCIILLSNYMLHRNPKYWEKPSEFMPERFLPENVAKRPHFSYVPFSAGLRSCIGQAFGIDVMKTAAVHLLRNLEFHSDLRLEDIPLIFDISVRSKIGYPVKVTRRNRTL